MAQNSKRSDAILNVLEQGEWVSHEDIYKRLPPECKIQMSARMATATTCRRLERLGKLISSNIEKSEYGHKKLYSLPPSIGSQP